MAPSSRRILWALAGSSMMPLALACNGIVGLSDYTRGECSGGGICSDAGLPDVVTTDGSPDAGEAGTPGKGADPVSWARWPMPNYVIPDAATPGVAPKLEPGTAGEVKDTITGLTWRSKVEGNNAVGSLADAEEACRKIAPAGDWRVPKRIELVTLLDYGHGAPFIDSTSFPGFPQARVWSSSEVRPFTGGPEQRYWTVNFDNGAVEPAVGANAAAVTLCVKAR